MKLIFLSIAAFSLLTACNTTIGLGRDMRVLGTEMEKKADEVYTGGSGETDNQTNEDFSGGAPVY